MVNIFLSISLNPRWGCGNNQAKILQKVIKIAITHNALESDIQWKGAKAMTLHSLLSANFGEM